MKCSELWLREWVNPNLNIEQLCQVLTMAGLEVEEHTPVAAAFSDICIGEVVRVEKHPQVDRLHICEVNIGGTSALQIVCGAMNVKAKMKVAVAKNNAVLPGGKIITLTSIQGISSQGMLCSASELQLGDDSEGILELPIDAPIGQDLRIYMTLQDEVIDIAITPNRGDCLSVKGMAREIAALTEVPLQNISISAIPNTIKDKLPIKVTAQSACPRYVGRVIRGIRKDVISPIWLKERLRRSGIRSIHPVVDVTNYVMLELGQPMHAFDLDKITQGIEVRFSKQNEKIDLLDGSSQTLNAETLVIADQQKPLAIAGVMGGESSSVTLTTSNILLESAYFSSQVIAKQRQYYNLNSDSAYRFERGIDAAIQSLAIERATQLILEIAGGEPGPVMEEVSQSHLPPPMQIALEKKNILSHLGVSIADHMVESIFTRLNFPWTATYSDNEEVDGWKIEVPSYRCDIAIPEDLIEEIARIYGYDKIPTLPMREELGANLTINANTQQLSRLRNILRAEGLHEIISYSFISETLQKLFDPQEMPRHLLNPISAEMAVMRTSLWPGLINALIYNKSRQQHIVRLFEIGTCFISRENQILQIPRLGGLISGLATSEQWGMTAREVDFFDLKGTLESLLDQIGLQGEVRFESFAHPALHPGQTAAVFRDNQNIGVIGALHPTVLQSLDVKDKVYVFELNLDGLNLPHAKAFSEVSKFPEIRRDIAILINQAIPAKDIQATIRGSAGDWLKEVFIFDLYQGKGISPDYKSIALALILQHPTRTLIDEEVAELIDRVMMALKGQLGAQLRS